MTPTVRTPATTGEVWEFDIGVSTHDLLKEAITVHHYTRVTVAWEGSFEEAQDIACGMASCGGWMPTVALVRL